MKKHVLCLGGGLIGSGWAARFALAGVNVTVFDPAPASARTVAGSIEAAERAWRRLAPQSAARRGAVRVLHQASELPEALQTVDFVQESLPEREDLKQQALADIEPLLGREVIIASSTSGLLPSRLQSALACPQRFCVAHPFTPVYLLPLVELCGGDQTAAETPQQAAAFYRALGMLPLLLKKEIDGFVADRLMEALWREALWLVHDDIATAAEIDDAIRLGCGLRWAFMGPFLTYRLGGGEGGMRHFMAQFAPALKLPWTKLMDTPAMDDALLNKIAAQSDAQAAGASIAELMQWRDDCLVNLLRALQNADTGIGQALAQSARLAAEPAPADAPAAAPPQLHQTRVEPAWIDYNGHMTESRYLQVFGEATDALLAHIGVDADYVAGGGSYYTVETHLRHLAQAYKDETLTTATQLLGMDSKRLHVFHTLRRGETLLATAEAMLLHVRNDRAAEADAAVLKRAAELAQAHAALPLPEGAGRQIRMPGGL